MNEMNAQQLKNSILQMAVQGKLVPQDPNDEPASVLLERIRAEKEKLIKEGKIKKEKNTSYIFRGEDNLPYEKVGKNEPVCIADEVPFEIPDSWEWVRLGTIGDTNIGLTYRPSDKTDSSGTLVLRSSNIQDGKMDYSDCVYVSCTVPERAMISKGDILICARNGSRSLVGKCAIVDDNGMAFGAFMAKFSSMFNPYIKVFIDSPAFRGQLEGVKTETINQITQDMLRKQLIPLPPLNEQKRIVEALAVIQTYVDRYDNKETELSALNSIFPDTLKKSILQQAVMGKLVPQDSDDEPASILLERIRAEKQALIKAGKLKKDKHESIIYRRDNSYYEKLDGIDRCIDDEIPFEIPNSWTWVRLSSVIDVRDGTHDTPRYIPSGYPLITGKDFYTGVFDLSKTQCISEADYLEINKRSKVDVGDILFSMIGGNIGSMIRITADNYFEMAIKNVALFKQYNYSLSITDYLYVFLQSQISSFKSIAQGGAQSFVSLNVLRNYLFPLPPIEEQKRIVKRIEELSSLCGSI